MKIKMGPFEVSESGGAMYVSPEINGDDLTDCWAMWLWPDGSADIYLKRKKDGAVLGKSIKIEAPKHEHRFEHEKPRIYRPCLGCGRVYKFIPPSKNETQKDGLESRK